ncbi:glucose-methanol-choline oxidoreductase [Gammaproteobacteria bacterium 45_16_T64]|nr:glucose-methanol-choline oxidoreductase [Gammaproteobacteria bacterium 45_16_T64]
MKTVKLAREQGLPVTQASDIKESTIELTADVVVVGSGAGGAVIAYEMAAAGKSVIILEAGPYVPSKDFTEKFPDMLEWLYEDQGAQLNSTGDLGILQGRCVGGSTVVNGAVTFRTPDVILEKWNSEYGLTALTKEALTPYFDRVEKNLSVHENQPHEIAKHSQILNRGAKALGYSHKPLKRNTKNCGLTGHCLSGCASDRKQSSLVTYLPWAISHGAKLFADTRAMTIDHVDGKAVGVTAETRDPATGKKIADVIVRANTVVSSAGAVQSPLLFLRSKLGNSSGQVGKNFACHPSTLMLAEFDEEVHAWRGAALGSYVDEFEHPDKGGFILEGGGSGPVEIAMAGEPGTGKDYVSFMSNAKNMCSMVTLFHDHNVGHIYYDGDKKVIDYDISDEDFPTMQRVIKEAAKVFLAAGAKRVLLPTIKKTEVRSLEELDQQIDLLENEPHTMRMISYHPQGTMRMGPDKSKSVVDGQGQSHDIRGLYVADASLFPTSVIVNPQITVYALSTYIADKMLEAMA